MNAGIDIVTLLKIDVLEEVAAHNSHRNRVPKHLDAGNVRNPAFNRHQPLAEIFINTRNDVTLSR